MTENRLPMGARPPPWGKRRPDGREQALTAHCRDVAAVFTALARLPGMRWRLARLAGVADLSEIWIERLGWFVYLHDLGKTNAGFQARRDPQAPNIGHVQPIAGKFDSILEHLELEKYCSHWGDETALVDWLHAVLSHHGKPWTICESHFGVKEVIGSRTYWQPQAGYDPMAALREFGHAGRALFPAAFTDPDGPPLPLTPPLRHALAGLTMLADWIASSDWEKSPSPQALTEWAAARLVAIGLDPAPWRAALAARQLDFTAAFGFAPTPAQTMFANAEGALAILESETGSGKTEAALWRFVERFRHGAVDGLYFALPTRTAAVQLHDRVTALVKALWPDDPPPVVLGVPGYLDEASGGALPDAHDLTDGTENDARAAPIWAAEHPKRFFSAMIGVGTIDQALLAVLRTKHAHLRGAALMRLMLVIDEVHASDAYGQALTEALLADHLAAGGEAALLSATLGARARCRYASPATRSASLPTLAEAIEAPYPALTVSGGMVPIAAAGREKTVSLALAEIIADPAAIAQHALAAAGDGAKVLVVRNSVAGAVAVQKALEAALPPDSPLLFRVAGVATLHHGRFAREDRRRLDAAVEAALGKTRAEGGKIVVGTQTLEQSLDIDADYLITDLCPVDVLLQRLGRLHRHAGRARAAGFTAARALVLTPAGDMNDLLHGRGLGFGLGPRGDQARGVYPDVIALEATRRLCQDRPSWKIPAMNRALVESALHPEAREKLVAALPEAWRRHLHELDGVAFADGGFARRVALDRDQPFMAADNAVCSDEIIATRLGEAGRLVDLPPGLIGPFGQPIHRLVIPGWWGAPSVDGMVVTALEGGMIQLEIGRLRLSYQRLGLMKENA